MIKDNTKITDQKKALLRETKKIIKGIIDDLIVNNLIKDEKIKKKINIGSFLLNIPNTGKENLKERNISEEEIKNKIDELIARADLTIADNSFKEKILKQINNALSTHCWIWGVDLQKPKYKNNQAAPETDKITDKTTYEYTGCLLSNTAKVLEDGRFDGRINLKVHNLQDCFKSAKFTLEIHDGVTNGELNTFAANLSDKMKTKSKDQGKQ